MRTTTSVAAGALAIALSACSPAEQPDPFLDAIPDAAGLTLEVQGGAAEGLALSVDPQAVLPGPPAPETPVTEDDLAVARAKLRALNEAVRAVFDRVEEVVARGGQLLPGDVKVYGPVDRCVARDPAGACLATATLRLRVQIQRPGLASFVLLARPVGSPLEADFAPVLAGWLARGAVPRRGVGALWVNFPNLAAAAPGFPGQGYLVAGFASGAEARAVTYRMLGFTRDPAVHDPVTAAFSGYHTAGGISRVRVAGLADLDPAGPDLELGLGHVVYHPASGGRAYTVVANWLDRSTTPPTPHGDVPAGQYWFGRACYAPGETLPAFKEWFLCPTGQGPAACVAALPGGWVGAVGTQVAGEPGATWAGTCALDVEPPELAPPVAPPPDDAGDASPEVGQDGTGLAPEPTPTDPASPDLTPPA